MNQPTPLWLLLSWLARASLHASVIALVVWLIIRLLRNRLPASVRFMLWLLVFARLVLPTGIPLHINWAWHPAQSHAEERSATAVQPAVRVVELIPIAAPSIAAIPATVHAPRAPAVAAFPWVAIFAGVWLCGVLLCLIRALLCNLRLLVVIRTLQPEDDPVVLHQAEIAAGRLNIRRSPRVLRAPANFGPALAGALRPVLLMPHCPALSPAELGLVLTHELAHLRRKDVAVNCVVACLTAIHWFNPLLWWALNHLREERELACDEVVLGLGAEALPSDYGQVLLKLIKPLGNCDFRSASTAVGLFEKHHTFTRRVAMISRYDRSTRRSRTVMVGALLVAGAVGLTEAAGPATAPAIHPAVPAGLASPAGAPGAAPKGITAVDLFPVSSSQSKPAPSLPTTVPQAVVDTDPAATAAATALLSRKMPELRFNANAMNDVFDFLADTSGANIFVDWGALESVGVGKDAPVSIKVKDVTLGTAIGLVLQSGGGGADLGYTVQGGVIRISTAAVGSKMVTETYDVTSLSATHDELQKAITEAINHDSGFRIAEFQSKLIITTTASNQQQIGALLQSLHEKGGVSQAVNPKR